MFDKRLIAEIKGIRAYYRIETAVAIATALFAVFQALLIADMVNQVLQNKHSPNQYYVKLLTLAFIMLAKTILSTAIDHYNRKCAIKIKFRIKKRLLVSITNLGPVRIRDQQSGKLVAIIEEGVEAFDGFYSEFLPQLFTVAIALPVTLCFVMKRDLTSGFIMLATAPLIPVFMILIGKIADYLNKKQWKSLVRMSGHLLDVLKGLPTLWLFSRSKAQGRIVERVSDEFRTSTIGILKVSFLSALVLELVATLSTAILSVTLGVRLLYGKILFKDAFFILLMAPEYYMPLRNLGAKFHAAMSAKASADSVYSLAEQECLKASEKFLAKEDFSISVEKLAFSYEEEKALKYISFDIEKGQKLALIGPSGGGKSTIISILMGFLEDYQGSVKVNGQELRNIDRKQWAKNFAYVPQQPKVFKATILNNITMSCPNKSFDEVEKAAKEIGIHKFIEQLPQGYNTLVGDGGIKLSGGQIQLLAITRAYLKDAVIMILDEPTSGLDVETEKNLGAVLKQVFKDKIVVTIAHRIPTIIDSDKILYIENGYILEQGTHNQLLSQKGAYYRLLTSQEVTV